MEDLIFLACPYSHPSAEVREQRFRAANIAAAKMLQTGALVYSSISHTHPIAVDGKLGLEYGCWYRLNSYYIKLCTKMVVLMLPGWRESRGVTAELQLAGELHKPVEFIQEVEPSK